MKVLVVGTGLAGATCAERMASQGHDVTVTEKRIHVAGLCFDHLHGDTRVQRYGAHIFHTESKDVWDYLSKFTEWRDYRHRVLAQVGARMLPLPPNLDTLEAVCDGNAEGAIRAKLSGDEDSVTIGWLRHNVPEVGLALHWAIYLYYNRRQWGTDSNPAADRLKVRLNRETDYFRDPYQGIPVDGYAGMVARMLGHPQISVSLGTRFVPKDANGYDKVFYTGPLDEYFQCEHGPLPYRSLAFGWGTSRPQCAPVVNYPQSQGALRSIDHAQVTGVGEPGSVISQEYGSEYLWGMNEPLYPSETGMARIYKKQADSSKAHFVGRLAEYRYYNMDQVVARALQETCESSS